jgi:hypothetical protein
MTKIDAKRKREPKGRDPEQFQRFIEAARKRDMSESLEDFAVRFGKNEAHACSDRSLPERDCPKFHKE